jgi:PKD repeat protein
VVDTKDLVIASFADSPDPFSPNIAGNKLTVTFKMLGNGNGNDDDDRGDRRDVRLAGDDGGDRDDNDDRDRDRDKDFIELIEIIQDLATGATIRKLTTRAEITERRRDSWEVTVVSAWDGKNNAGQLMPDGTYNYVAFGRIVEERNGWNDRNDLTDGNYDGRNGDDRDDNDRDDGDRKDRITDAAFPISGSVMLDQTSPAITATRDKPANAAGWNNSNVTVSFNCSDAASGVAMCPAPVVVSTETASLVVSGTVVDRAGNSATASLTIKLDKTVPLIQGALSPLPNANSWNNADVTALFTATDALSGVQSVTPPVVISTEGAQQNVTGTAMDIAGNTSIATLVVNLDKTLPSLAIASPASGSTVAGPAVDIRVTYSDALSGLALSTYRTKLDGVDFTSTFTVGPADATYKASLGPGLHIIEASILDTAGNAIQASGQFTVGAAFRSLPEAIPTSGPVPLTVRFITKAEYPSGQIMRYRWDFQGDGIWDTNEPGARDFTRTFTTQGTFDAKLEVLNDKNEIAIGTVTVTVHGNPPTATASVNPSNGPIPLLVNLMGSGTDVDGTIVKYEWDFQGDGVFDYSSTTTGNTTFTYTSEGTHNAVFRVTDNQGLTGTATATATAIRVGPPGSPTATITVPANPLTANAPVTVSFNGTGSDTGGSITKYEWDFDGDGTYDYSSATTAATTFRYTSPGSFTVAFRVTDNDGNKGIDTVGVNINIAATLTLSTDTLRPPATINVNTTIGGTTEVTIFLRNKAGQRVRTLVNNVTRNAGPYSDPWDGKDDAGNTVPEGVYYAILQYTAGGETRLVDLTNTTGNVFFNPAWDLSTSNGGSCFNCPFAPYEDNFLKNTFMLNQAAEVTVSIRGFFSINEFARLFDRRPFGRGTHIVYWDGANALGQLVHPPPADSQFIWGMTAFTFPTNGIIVEVAPQFTTVAVTPNYLDPATGDFLTPENPNAKVTFTLTKNADVVLEVYPVGSTTPIRTITAPNLPSGQSTIQWDGKASNGLFVAKGDYRLALKAADAAGSQSIVRYLLMKVFYEWGLQNEPYCQSFDLRDPDLFLCSARRCLPRSAVGYRTPEL